MKKCMCCMRDYSEHHHICPLCGYSQAQAAADRENMPDALAVETIIAGRFVLGRVLSITDYSVIYIAWDALLSRKVAIREYLPLPWGQRGKEGEVIFASHEEEHHFRTGQEAFDQEALSLSRHQELEEVIHVYRIVHDNETSYAVMEYLEGETLADHLEVTGGVAKEEAVNIFNQLANVLNRIHKADLVHGNLTPENIYRDERGQLKLIDFGKGKAKVDRMADGELSLLDPSYTAPEVLRKGQPGLLSDIYSLGALYYRLLSGKEPPVIDQAGRRRGGLHLDRSRKAEKLIVRMMDLNPDKRPDKIETGQQLPVQAGGNEKTQVLMPQMTVDGGDTYGQE